MKQMINYIFYNNFKKNVIKNRNIILQDQMRSMKNVVFYDKKEERSFSGNNYFLHKCQKPVFIGELKKKYSYQQPFFNILENAYLVGKHATVIWNNKIILDSILGSKGYLIYKSDIRSLRFQKLKAREKIYDTVLSLVNCINGSYFHWVAEALPLLESLFVYEKMYPKEKVYIVVNAPVPSFIFEWLDMFGIEKERIIPWQLSKVKVKKLIMPSVRYYRLETMDKLWARHLFPKSVFDFIRENIHNNMEHTLSENQYSRKVYLSRNDSDRNVANEDELEAFLKKWEFLPDLPASTKRTTLCP